jgi:UDP-glucuronate 4-epimerase
MTESLKRASFHGSADVHPNLAESRPNWGGHEPAFRFDDMSRYLVTGAAGFVGAHTVRALLEEGHVVVGVDSFTDYYDPELKRRNVERLAGDRFELVEADLTQMDLVGLLDGVEAVIHLAGQPGVRRSWGEEFDLYLGANVRATQLLLEAARSSRTLRRLVYASSSSVYGDAERYPTSETDLPRPRSPYGVTKLAAEHLCTLYASNFGVPTTSLRYFTVYGPRQRPDMAFTRFIANAIEGSVIEVYGDGEQARDFTYVGDVVSANLLAAEADLPPGTVMNIAGGDNVTVNQVLDVLAGLRGGPLDIEYLPPADGDVRRTGADGDRAHRNLGWSPTVKLADGLQRQYAAALSGDGV